MPILGKRKLSKCSCNAFSNGKGKFIIKLLPSVNIQILLVHASTSLRIQLKMYGLQACELCYTFSVRKIISCISIAYLKAAALSLINEAKTSISVLLTLFHSQATYSQCNHIPALIKSISNTIRGQHLHPSIFK